MKNNEKEKKVSKKVFENIIIAVAVMIYFMLINFMYNQIEDDKIYLMIKGVCTIVLALTILVFEIAYHKDSGKIAINAIELLVLSIHLLTSLYIVKVANFDFKIYILASSYVFSAYYILKAIIVYTNEKRIYLKSLSDISQIVEIEPIKKKATKKQKNKD